MKSLCVVVAIMIVSAVQAEGAGVNIAWDTCGPAGSERASSSCTSNVGTRSFVVSFVPEEPFDGASVVGCRLLIWTDNGNPLPSWWQMAAGSCREGGLDIEFHGSAGSPCDTIPSVMTDWDYVQQQVSPSTAYLFATSGSTGTGIDLVPGQEYFVLRANINQVKTVGADSCGGCWTPMGIVVEFVSVASEQESFSLDDPDRRREILWQPDIVPTRATTWGQIKRLYRGRR